MDVEKLKSQRASTKASMTRIFNWLNKNKDTELNILQFKNREETLKSSFDRYTSLQDEIEDSLMGNTDNENRIEVEDKYYDTLSILQKCIENLDTSTSNITQTTFVANTNNNNPYIQSVSQKFTGVKLPDINIAPFCGNIAEWKSFFEIFKAVIIDNNSLSDVQRLFYLKSYLKGEPLRLIDSLLITNDNFQTAVNILKKRYENINCIVNAHISSLLETPVIAKCNRQNLREFVTNCKRNLESLKNFNLGEEQLFEIILIYILQKKLDFGTRRYFEQQRNISDLPTLNEFFDFLEEKCVVMENLESSEQRTGTRPSRSTSSITLHSTHSPKPQIISFCIFCKNNHRIYLCEKFKEASFSEKMKFVKLNHVCSNCLGSKHTAENCKSMHRCKVCSKKHHTVLHNPNYFNAHKNRDPLQENKNHQTCQIKNTPNSNLITPNSNSQNVIHYDNNYASTSHSQQLSDNTTNTSLSCSAFSHKCTQVLLATARVTLYKKDGQPIQVKALLDSGSQISFITKSLAEKLNCTPYNALSQIRGIAQSSTIANKVIDVIFFSNPPNVKEFSLSCYILDQITDRLPQVFINVDQVQIPESYRNELADPLFSQPSEIDLLLGADIYYSLLSEGILNLGNGLPYLLNTQLGWVVAGNFSFRSNNKNHVSTFASYHAGFNIDTEVQPVEEILQKFWNIEEVPEQHTFSPEDELVEKIFSSTTKILSDGSYQVDIPLKTPNETLKLGNSLNMAQKRFYTLERRFQKDPQLFVNYKKFIDEYIDLGHAKFTPFEMKDLPLQNKYFIPHLCVTREESATTKFRVVFDASARTSTGYSLNDITFKGYQVQPALFDILCRFRLFKYALTTDIEKMYRRIKINPNQTFLQNILWRNSSTESFKCIELLTVTYGTNFAPYVATRVLKEVAQKNLKKFPIAASSLLFQCYMDDILSGANEIHEFMELFNQLNYLLNGSGFHLHKWCTNHPELLKALSMDPPQECDFNFEGVPSKVLGLQWHPLKDMFCISVPKIPSTQLITKRIVLSTISQCFDPLGLVNPVIVKGKILMQTLWCKKLSWDEEILDESVLTHWNKFLSGLSLVKNLNISRYLFTQNSIQKVELHGFADASLLAYGACIYMRTLYTDSTVSSHLISAKSRVAPIKTVSLPKLELCGMLLLAKLAKSISSIFKNNVQIDSIHLWTDSQIALQWCRNHPSKFNVFVANRVSQIQTLTSTSSWHHVKSADNPADLLSRGLFTQETLDSGFWFHGPKWLQRSSLDFESAIDRTGSVSNLPELRKTTLHTLSQDTVTTFWYDIFRRFSNFTRLQRTVAYILRYVSNSKQQQKKVNSLSVEELDRSLTFIVHIIQQHYFHNEIDQISNNRPLTNTNLLRLKVFLDSAGVLRVGGRLDQAQIEYDQKHPILLPSHDYIVQLMLTHEHKRLGHAGAQTVLSNFRLRYWPLNALRQIKRIIRNCLVCFRFSTITNSQIMASLPKERVTISRPFQNVGVDFAGPVFIKTSKLRKAPLIKCYISLFVCMVTKAVHIEAVTNLSSDAFILTLKRFIARRGNPSCVFSDNGTNFVGASNQLKEIQNFFKKRNTSDCFQDYLTQNEIKWKFIPPRSPHWGGLWESAIKSAKFHLVRLVGNAKLTYEELSTVLCQVESIMNSRPLSQLSNDPSDLNALTPGHFLIGNALTAHPERDITHIPETRLSLYQKISQIKQVFWKRWSVEYLNRLQNRPKWFRPTRNFALNDLVLLKEDNTPPLIWPLARIIEVMPSTDGKVRVVRLQTGKDSYVRPITKICLLPNQDCIPSLDESPNI